jgi:two-component system C4-dicarboxylate transport sensor histidine kinase DctB
MRRPGSARFWVSLLLLITATFGALAWLQSAHRTIRAEARARFFEQYNRQQLLLAEQTARGIEDAFQALRGNLGLLASLFEDREVTQASVADVQATMRRMHENLSGTTVSDMALFDRQGTVVTSYPPSPGTVGTDLSWRDYFIWARDEGKPGQIRLVTVRPLAAGTMRGQEAMLVVEGIYGKDRTFRGLALIAVDFKEVARRHVLSVRIGQSGYAWLVDRKAQTVLVDPTGRMGGRSLGEAFQERWPRLYRILTSTDADEPGTDWYEYEDFPDQESTVRKLVAYSPVHIADESWLVGVTTPEREVETLFSSFLDRQQGFSATFALTVLVVGIGACGLLVSWNTVLTRRVSVRTQDLERAQTRLQETFEELLASRKLATVGQLATGLAHEIRNPLSAIRLNVQGIREELQTNEHLRENFDIVEGEILRLNHLLTQLLGYARPRPLRTASSDIGAEVRRALQLTGRLLADEGVEVGVDCQGDLLVVCDPEQIRQVLLNLCLNAVEAMRENGGPRRLDVAAMRLGAQVTIRVADTGPGVAPADRERLFEPFFTTKAQGGGLGLATVQSIVVRHGGTVEVESDGLHGAAFIVRLPVQGPAISGTGAP